MLRFESDTNTDIDIENKVIEKTPIKRGSHEKINFDPDVDTGPGITSNCHKSDKNLGFESNTDIDMETKVIEEIKTSVGKEIVKRPSRKRQLEGMEKIRAINLPRPNYRKYNPKYPVDEETFKRILLEVIPPNCSVCHRKYKQKESLLRHWNESQNCKAKVVLGQSLVVRLDKVNPSTGTRELECAHEDAGERTRYGVHF